MWLHLAVCLWFVNVSLPMTLSIDSETLTDAPVDIIASANGEFGFLFVGGANTVEANQSSYNGGGGFIFCCDDNSTVSLNHAEGNGLNGFEVFASTGNTFTRNRSSNNGRPASGFGIADFRPGSNTYTDNLCTGNGLGDSDPPGLCR